MPRCLRSLALLATLGMAPMALSAPTSSTSFNSTQSFTISPTLNTTTPLNSSLVPRGDEERYKDWFEFAKKWETTDKWAQFCDDPNCSQNCGISVHMLNPGCLEQPRGRKSIKFHGMRRDLEFITLTISPRKGCNCQAFCSAVEWTGPRVSPQQNPFTNGVYPTNQHIDFCWTISMFEWYDLHTEWSFRFHWNPEYTWCGADQCRWDNTFLESTVPH